jgi:hypothetical protein
MGVEHRYLILLDFNMDFPGEFIESEFGVGLGLKFKATNMFYLQCFGLVGSRGSPWLLCRASKMNEFFLVNIYI